MAQSALNQDKNIQDFTDILKNNKLDSQFKNFTEMLGYVSNIENKLQSALSDVTKLEKRVNEMEDKQFKNICMKTINNIKSMIHTALDKLNEIKSAIVNGAKRAVTAVKEKGISALNSVMKLFKFKESLTSVKNMLNTAVNKLDNLDKTVQMNKEKKPSLLASVRNFKPPARSDNADNSKKIESSID